MNELSPCDFISIVSPPFFLDSVSICLYGNDASVLDIIPSKRDGIHFGCEHGEIRCILRRRVYNKKYSIIL